MSIDIDIAIDHEDEDWITIDGNNRLGVEDLEDMIGKAMLRKGRLTEDQVETINQAIEAWAERDPMGDDDYESRVLAAEIAAIVEGGS